MRIPSSTRSDLEGRGFNRQMLTQPRVVLAMMAAVFLLGCQRSGSADRGVIKSEVALDRQSIGFRPRPGENLLEACGHCRYSSDGVSYEQIDGQLFQMGCSPGDNNCQNNERPVRTVEAPHRYWIGSSEVPIRYFVKFIKANHREHPIYSSAALPRDLPDFPATQVTWDDAEKYCESVGGRLPTELEWEYAARGGTTGARYGDTAEISWGFTGSPQPAGRKWPNEFGLFDVLGNVQEWVLDEYNEHYRATAPADLLRLPVGTTERVIRDANVVRDRVCAFSARFG